MAQYNARAGYKRAAPMLRVVWTNSEAGDVVKFYNAKTFNDVLDMKGFVVKSWEKVRGSMYAAFCNNTLKRKEGV